MTQKNTIMEIFRVIFGEIVGAKYIITFERKKFQDEDKFMDTFHGEEYLWVESRREYQAELWP